MLLVPTLLLTSSVAVLAWGWAVASFVVARWIYNHTPFGVNETPNGIRIMKEGSDGKY